jgi:hypothetical protein
MSAPGRYSIAVEVPYWNEEQDGRVAVANSSRSQKYAARSQPIIVEVDRIYEAIE